MRSPSRAGLALGIKQRAVAFLRCPTFTVMGSAPQGRQCRENLNFREYTWLEFGLKTVVQPGLQHHGMRFLIYLLLLRTKLASSELSARLCKKVTSLDQSVVTDGVSQGFLISEVQMLIFFFFFFLSLFKHLWILGYSVPVWVRNSLEIRERVFSMSVCQLEECSHSVLLLRKALKQIHREE